MRFALSVILSWLLFIGIDFFFHAGILQSLWEQDIAAVRTSEELFRLIPFGYLSFMLQTTLIGYITVRSYPTRPSAREILRFAVIIGILFSTANLFAIYSYITIPFKNLLAFNLVFFVETVAVVVCFSAIFHASQMKKSSLTVLLIFLALIVSGLIAQNIL